MSNVNDDLNDMVGLAELTSEQRQRNRAAAEFMVIGLWYEFTRPIQTIPVERHTHGSENFGQPIMVTKGKYLGFDQQTEEHLFSVLIHNGGKTQLSLAPLFLDTGGGPICQPCEPPMDATVNPARQRPALRCLPPLDGKSRPH